MSLHSNQNSNCQKLNLARGPQSKSPNISFSLCPAKKAHEGPVVVSEVVIIY